MEKRVLGILLVLALCVGIFPAEAFAASSDFQISNVKVAALAGDPTAGLTDLMNNMLKQADPQSSPDGTASAATRIIDSATGLTYDEKAGQILSYDNSQDNLVIPASLGGIAITSIGTDAFYDCTKLTALTIPNGVTSIEDNAFDGCSSLTSITLPNSVTSIGEGAFSDCHSLTSITLPSELTSITGSAFSKCSSLNSINVDSTNANYTSIDGVLYDNSKTKLVAYPSGKSDTTYAILNDVTSIGKKAFIRSSLTSVTIPPSVTLIDDGAFMMCSKLKSAEIPGSVTSIGENAFDGCKVLSSITIPNAVTSIKDDAFMGCAALTSVAIPNGVTTIGVGSFESCSSLSSIIIPSSVTSIDGASFSPGTTVTIKGADGSYAQRYAKRKGINFIITLPAAAGSRPNFAATPTVSTVVVNGIPAKFDAYSINGNNFFKLRDLASILNGSSKQFEVTWDGTNNAINLLSNKPYTNVGGEMKAGDGKSKSALSNASSIYIDGKLAKLTAYTINGNNFFKLRDIGQVFNIGIGWDSTINTITIDTSTGYAAP